MKIKYVKGDLLASDEKLIIHGCNAKGAFASGFAGAVRAKYPGAYNDYMRTHREMKLSMGQIIWTQGDIVIGNAITQSDFGRENKQYVSYAAIAEVMDTINLISSEGIPYGMYKHGFDRIAMPKIGAGLGGGDWSIIEEIIESKLTRVQPVVYELT